MRILIVAPGSRGDVQPYIALGIGLKEAGHAVRFLTHRNFESLVVPSGLDFLPAESNAQEIAERSNIRARIEKGNFFLLMRQMAKAAEQEAVHFAKAGIDSAKAADVILAGMGGIFLAIALAEKFNLPVIQAYLLPFTPTGYYPSVLLPNVPSWFQGWPNRISHHLTRFLIWQGFSSADTLVRRKILGIPASPPQGPYHSSCLEGMPVLHGYSPTVIPPPPDWDKRVHVTGYWTMKDDLAWKPPESLNRFLDTGEPPVYIGFGSMSNRDPKKTTELVLEALRLVRRRAIMLSGWGGMQQSDLPDTVYMIDSVPHEWLFPRMAMVAHHGGAGTTAAGFLSGVPSLAIPFFGDQPFWGRRIFELGVGPLPIPRTALSAKKLAHAIQFALEDNGVKERAAALGSRLRAENGIANAISFLHQINR